MYRKDRNAVHAKSFTLLDQVSSFNLNCVDDWLNTDSLSLQIREAGQVDKRWHGRFICWHVVVTVSDWPDKTIVVFGVEQP